MILLVRSVLVMRCAIVVLPDDGFYPIGRYNYLLRRQQGVMQGRSDPGCGGFGGGHVFVPDALAADGL